MDFTGYDDSTLEALRLEVLTEQERRASLASIPAQLTILAAAFVAAGGDQLEVDAAVGRPTAVTEAVLAPADPTTLY